MPKDMPTSTDSKPPLFDPVHLSRVMADVMERAQPIFRRFIERHAAESGTTQADPLDLQSAHAALAKALLADPEKLVDLQVEYWGKWMTLCHNTALRIHGEQAEDIYKPETGDRRFRSPLWKDSPYFDFIKQSYLMTSRWMQDAARTAKGLDAKTMEKIEFSIRQFSDALAPTNFLMTNPEVIRETLATGGENLVRGLENFLSDMERSAGALKISTTDYNAFAPGRNLAITPGKVVHRNRMMELIQYTPSTKDVFKRPLLVVPPWINKYYILDLRPENSFVRWLVDQGHTVFMISWVNPSQDTGPVTFDDYMTDGLLKALSVIAESTGEKDANVIGYCIGGTLLAIAMAWLAAGKEESRIASATFLTTLIDFEKAGELKLFTDCKPLDILEKDMAGKGVLSASHLQRTFSLLRANDLIWSFVINNYLMGKEPFPFDILYWNDDSTNLPADMHRFYLRTMYRDNRLIEPGAMTIAGRAIDIGTIRTPCHFLSTREDHIAPWKATYAGTRLFKGPVSFTLAASGHVAGIVNPPDAGKYGCWTADHVGESADEWLKTAKEQKESWWILWQQWIGDHTGKKVPARPPGGGRITPLDDAPGLYVKKA